eukprot:TRINITY_DN2585_c0_g4_i1.p1 TRINITY_DN2585_c0_g4~~TRINITY_DN2585_c0_g4_i1.p1  ORF type:complete len:3465 (-),score=761.39 TRINITY_DN2585_c0_g4_i1:310-10323(-)
MEGADLKVGGTPIANYNPYQLPLTSVDECRELCESESTCVAFSWNKGALGAKTYYRGTDAQITDPAVACDGKVNCVPECNPMDSYFPVRCCNLVGSAGATTCEGDSPFCQLGKFSDAERICKEQGFELCSQAQVEAECLPDACDFEGKRFWLRETCDIIGGDGGDGMPTYDCYLMSAIGSGVENDARFNSGICQTRSPNDFPLDQSTVYQAQNLAPGEQLWQLDAMDPLHQKWAPNEDWTMSFKVTSKSDVDVKFGLVPKQALTNETNTHTDSTDTSFIAGPKLPEHLTVTCAPDTSLTTLDIALKTCFDNADGGCTVVVDEWGKGEKWRNCVVGRKNWQIDEIFKQSPGNFVHNSYVLSQSLKKYGGGMEGVASFKVTIPKGVINHHIIVRDKIQDDQTGFALLQDHYNNHIITFSDVFFGPGVETTKCDPIPKEWKFEPADACTWLFGFSKDDDNYECADGTACSGGAKCCDVEGTKGPVAKCPKNKPLMCNFKDEESNGVANADHGCDTSCDVRGGLRECRKDAMGSTSCHVSGQLWTPDLEGTGATTEASAENCQRRCHNTAKCVYFSYNTGDKSCRLAGQLATWQLAGGYKSGPRTCASRMEVSSNLNTRVPGDYSMHFSCTDSVGQTAAVARTVKIGCEGPNPRHVFGGNNVPCDEELEARYSATNEMCADRCINIDLCEAWIMDTVPGICRAQRKCSGRYVRDEDQFRQVGYCRRQDHPPWVVLATAECCTQYGVAWQEAPYECKDREDPFPPTPKVESTIVLTVPGIYEVKYTCKDLAQKEVYETRTVVVTGRCNVEDDAMLNKLLTSDPDSDPDPNGLPDNTRARLQLVDGKYDPCKQGQIKFLEKEFCTPHCQSTPVKFDSSLISVKCVQIDPTQPDVEWEKPFYCGLSACDAPTVAFVKDIPADPGVPVSCEEGPRPPHKKKCTPNCMDGYWATEPFLYCDTMILTPLTFVCLKKAEQPGQVVPIRSGMTKVYVWADLTWGDGSAGNDCVFQRWRVQGQILSVPFDINETWPDDPNATSGPGILPDIWRDVPGCTTLTVSRSEASCRGMPLFQGTAYLFRVREECAEPGLNSPWSTVSIKHDTEYVTPPTIIFKSPSEDVVSKPDTLLVAVDEKLVTHDIQPANFTMSRYCPWYPRINDEWTTTHEEVVEKASDGPYVMLTGSRILIIKLPAVFVEKGCEINVTVGRGWLATLQQPRKPFPESFWQFTYIDVKPAWNWIQVIASELTINSCKIAMEFSLGARFSCTATKTGEGGGCGADGVTNLLSNNVFDQSTLDSRCASRKSDAGLTYSESDKWSYVGKDWTGVAQEQTVPGMQAPDFSITQLFPGTHYKISCVGHKIDDGVDRFWVPLEEQPSNQDDAVKFKTAEDTEKAIDEFKIVVRVCCGGAGEQDPPPTGPLERKPCADADSEKKEVTTEEVSTAQMSIGYTFQVKEWKDRCNTEVDPATGNAVGKNLEDGQHAYFQIEAIVTKVGLDSHLVYAQDCEAGADQPCGPILNYDFEKTGTDAPLAKEFRFKLCPLAHYNGVLGEAGACVNHKLVVQLVDITIDFSDIQMDMNIGGAFAPRRLESEKYSEAEENYSDSRALLQRRLQVTPDTRQDATLGTKITIKAATSSSDPNAVYSEITMYLGAPAGGFKLPMVLGGSEFTMELQGQGMDLPLIAVWKGAVFFTKWAIYFPQPVIEAITAGSPATANPAKIEAHQETEIVVELSNVPDLDYLGPTGKNVFDPTKLDSGYALPSNFVKLEVYKNGQTANLCGPTTFNGGWKYAKCGVQAGAVSDLFMKMFVFKFYNNLWHPVEDVHGKIQYVDPIVTDVVSDGQIANTWHPLTGLGTISMLEEPMVYIQGVKLPKDVSLGNGLLGARIPGYEVHFQDLSAELTANGPIEFCKDVTWMNATYLRCTMHRCIHFAKMPRQPKLRLFLGDLTNAADLENKIIFPRPVIRDFGPRRTFDVGLGREYWFAGYYFGERKCWDDLSPMDPAVLFGGAQVSAFKTQLVGTAAGLQITMGEMEAKCSVTFQNATWVTCVVNDPLMYPREMPDPLLGGATELTAPRKGAMQPIMIHLGAEWSMDERRMMNGDPNLPSSVTKDMLLMEIEVNLQPCPGAGMQRRHDLDHVCMSCPAGRFSLTSSPNYPLSCEICPEGEYQDKKGATRCKKCPENTIVTRFPDSIEACTCREGAYSQFYNVRKTKTIVDDEEVIEETVSNSTGGTPCIPCASGDLMAEPTAKENCGKDLMILSDCDNSKHTACVSIAPPLLVFKLCKVRCPGGLFVPLSKPRFWLLMHEELGVQKEGSVEMVTHQPLFLRCDPADACYGSNLCKLEYTGMACGYCKFGYWSDPKTNRCKPCGDEQVVGMVIMSGMSVCATFGVLVGVSSFMRFKGDLEFRAKLFQALKQNVLGPLEKVQEKMAVLKSPAKIGKSVVVRIEMSQTGSCFSYLQRRDFGVGFRVDDMKVVHLTGVHVTSPLMGKVNAGWKLQTINGQGVRAACEEDVLEILANASFPIRLNFLAKKTKIEKEVVEEVEEFDWADERRVFVVLLGCMNAFNGISGFDFEWPEIFLQMAAIAAQFSFDLNFFKPECSVKTAYAQKWLGFMAVPYFMLGPIGTAHLIARFFTLHGLQPQAYTIKLWSLKNAAARVLCTAAIILLPFHISTLLIPFCCVERGPGMYYVSANPTMQCTSENEEYVMLLQLGMMAAMSCGIFYTFLVTCLTRSYWWQYLNIRRDKIPFHCGLVETSVQAQVGYVFDVRKRVDENIASVHVFDPKGDRVRLRENVSKAVEELGWRARSIQHAVKVRKQNFESNDNLYQGLQELINYGEFFEDPKAEQNKTTKQKAKEMMSVIKARRKFKWIRKNPEKIEGSILTYGWIFIINQFIRGVVSSVVLRLTAGALMVVGACFQMGVFSFNVALLLTFQPYKATRIVVTEIVMLAMLFLIMWAAICASLVSSHVQAHLLQEHIDRMNRCIDMCAVLMIIMVFWIPGYNGSAFIRKVAKQLKGPDYLLNCIAWELHCLKEKSQTGERDRIQAGARLWEKNMGSAQDRLESMKLVRLMTADYPLIDKTLRKLQAGAAGSQLPEQRKQLARLVETIKANAPLLTAGVDMAACESISTTMKKMKPEGKDPRRKARKFKKDMSDNPVLADVTSTAPSSDPAAATGSDPANGSDRGASEIPAEKAPSETSGLDNMDEGERATVPTIKIGEPTKVSARRGTSNSAPAALPEEPQVLGKDKDWAEMSAEEQAAVQLLGWTESSWTHDDFLRLDKPWLTLTDEQRAAAALLGLSAEDLEEPGQADEAAEAPEAAEEKVTPEEEAAEAKVAPPEGDTPVEPPPAKTD